MFGRIVRDARIRAGLTQSELATLCQVSQPAIAQWEAEDRAINEKTLSRVAAALGLTVKELLRRGLPKIDAPDTKDR